MQQVFVVWDRGSDGTVYDGVNAALRRGARVVSMSSSSATYATPQAVVVFVLEGSEQELKGSS